MAPLSPPKTESALQTAVAVFGTGNIGLRHLNTLRRIEGVLPMAVPVRRERLQELEGMGYRACRQLEGARQLGASCAVIATDTGRHAADAIAALRLGFHLLVEKPLAVNAKEGRSILEEAERVGRSVWVGYVLRLSESLNRFRRWLPQIGRIHSVAIECRSYLPDWRPNRSYRETYSARAGEGGVLFDLIHEVDYSGWIFGWPRSFTGRLTNLRRLGIDAEEIAELNWQMPEGYPLSIHLDYLTRPPRRTMRAFGEHGTIEWDARGERVTLWLSERLPQGFVSPQTTEEQFLEQARAWLAAVEGKVDPRLAKAKEDVKTLEICDGIRRL